MREGPDVLSNETAGERVLVRQRPHGAGDPLCLTLLLSRPGSGPPPHAHPLQTEHFRVIRGALEIRVDEAVRVLGPGDECCVAPGAPHSWRPVDAPAEVEVTVRPALRFEQILERAFELVDTGAVTGAGIADQAAVATFLAEFGAEYELVAP